MKLDKGDAARTLAHLLEIRDFRKDSKLQERVYREELSGLVDRLRQEIREVSSAMHAGHTLTLDTKSTFALFLKDATSQPLATCYLDTSQTGVIRLKYLARSLDPQAEELGLDSPGRQGGYRWRSGDILVNSYALPEYLIQRLLEIASEAVVRETPGPPSD